MKLLPAANDARALHPTAASDPDDRALLEREAELARLATVVGSVAGGSGAVVVVEGPAGVGRTALLGSVRLYARSTGCEVLSASGGQAEQQFELGVARQLLEPAEGGAPCWPKRLPPPTDAAGWFTVLRELTDRVLGMATRVPVVLVIDDCQWADAASVRLLGFLARRIEAAPVGIVIAVRDPVPEPVRGPLTELRVECDPVLLRPRRLSAAAVSSVVRRMLGPAAYGELCAACGSATRGNPFLLEELLRDLTGTATVPDVARVHAAAPSRVAQEVGLRIGRLAVPADDLVRALAVLGEADLHSAASVADIDLPRAATAADALVSGGVLEWADAVLGFAYPIVRRALYEHTPRGWRSQAHLRAARLAAGNDALTTTVTDHLLRSDPGQDEWVVQQLRLAAGDAADRGAWPTALRCLRRALAEASASACRGELSDAVAFAASHCASEPVEPTRQLRSLRRDPRLTPTEQRVVDTIADGRTNREAAHALFVTVKTVEMHLSNAYRKLGITGRVQLAAALGGDCV